MKYTLEVAQSCCAVGVSADVVAQHAIVVAEYSDTAASIATNHVSIIWRGAADGVRRTFDKDAIGNIGFGSSS